MAVNITAEWINGRAFGLVSLSIYFIVLFFLFSLLFVEFFLRQLFFTKACFYNKTILFLVIEVFWNFKNMDLLEYN